MVEATARLVPGAPPPARISKSQKKKRKPVKGKSSAEADSAAVVPDAPASSVLSQVPSIPDGKEVTVVPSHVTTLASNEIFQPALEDDAGYKPSPVVDLVHKRLKAIHKKIVSIFLVAIILYLYICLLSS
jgi:hypothetical protein